MCLDSASANTPQNLRLNYFIYSQRVSFLFKRYCAEVKEPGCSGEASQFVGFPHALKLFITTNVCLINVGFSAQHDETCCAHQVFLLAGLIQSRWRTCWGDTGSRFFPTSWDAGSKHPLYLFTTYRSASWEQRNKVQPWFKARVLFSVSLPQSKNKKLESASLCQHRRSQFAHPPHFCLFAPLQDWNCIFQQPSFNGTPCPLNLLVWMKFCFWHSESYLISLVLVGVLPICQQHFFLNLSSSVRLQQGNDVTGCIPYWLSLQLLNRPIASTGTRQPPFTLWMRIFLMWGRSRMNERGKDEGVRELREVAEGGGGEEGGRWVTVSDLNPHSLLLLLWLCSSLVCFEMDVKQLVWY